MESANYRIEGKHLFPVFGLGEYLNKIDASNEINKISRTPLRGELGIIALKAYNGIVFGIPVLYAVVRGIENFTK